MVVVQNSFFLMGCFVVVVVLARATRPQNSTHPTFINTDKNITVQVGQTARLPCVVQNLGLKMVYWKKTGKSSSISIGNVLYSPDRNYNVEHEVTEIPGSSEWNLMITRVAPSHAGIYECRISTKKDERQIMRNITLNVVARTSAPQNYTLPTFINTERNISVQVGYKATLPCVVRNIGPKVVIWRKKDQVSPISIGNYIFVADNKYNVEHEDTKTSGSSEWNLTITSATQHHAGMYECRISTRKDERQIVRNVTLNVIDNEARMTRTLPTFIDTERNITVHVGQTATLPCVVKYVGRKKIFWENQVGRISAGNNVFDTDSNYKVKHKENEQPGSSEWNLTITGVTPSHAGRYICKLQTQDDEAIATVIARAITLNVVERTKHHPAIELSGTESVQIGSEIKLICSTFSIDYSPPDVDWFKDGVKLRSGRDGRVLIRKYTLVEVNVANSMLTIDHSIMKDAGTYVCRSTDLRVASLKVVVVKSRMTRPLPTFIDTERNITVHVGQTATLPCVVKYVGRKKIFWENQFGRISAGNSVFDTDSNYKVQHKENEQPGSSEWNLTITSVTPSHAGRYICKLQTQEDLAIATVIARGITLNVVERTKHHPAIELSGTESVQIGSEIKLICSTFSIDYSPPDVDWFKDGVKLRSGRDGRVLIRKYTLVEVNVANSMLTIDHSIMKDAGTYVCRSTDRRVASLKVVVVKSSVTGPLLTFMNTTRNIAVQIGQTARLPCLVKDFGPNKVFWRKNDQDNPISIGSHVFVSDISFSVEHKENEIPGSSEWNLLITRVEPSHAGIYECRIGNGKDQRQIVTLYVVDSSLAIQLTGTKYVNIGSVTRLMCSASAIKSFELLHVDWFKSGNKLPGKDSRVVITESIIGLENKKMLNSTLIIEHSTMQDAGTYICRVGNQISSLKVVVMSLNAES